MKSKRWNPALRHTVLGEPGNDSYLASRARHRPVLVIDAAGNTCGVFQSHEAALRFVRDSGSPAGWSIA